MVALGGDSFLSMLQDAEKYVREKETLRVVSRWVLGIHWDQEV